MHHKDPQLVASFTSSTVKRWLLHFKKWSKEISHIWNWPIKNGVLLPSLKWAKEHRHWAEEFKFELFSLSRAWDAEHVKRCWRSADTIYQAWRTKGDGPGCFGAVKWGIYTELKGSWIWKAFTAFSNTMPAPVFGTWLESTSSYNRIINQSSSTAPNHAGQFYGRSSQLVLCL